LLGDTLKGWIVVFLARFVLHLPDWAIASSAVAVFMGHLFPVFFSFRGGKGVATAWGVLLGLNPMLASGVMGVWILSALIWRAVSLSSILAALSAPPIAWFILHSCLYTSIVSILAILIVWRHKTNIDRLLQGTEDRIGKEKAE
jgi:glycerol-3-phosphate acyltransferase PlsY